MKKFMMILFAVACMAPVGIGNAAVWTEEYTGEQFVGEGDSYSFRFDLWYLGNEQTDSSLSLTQDAASGFMVEFQQASIYATLYSIDPEFEYANVSFAALSSGTELFSDSFFFSKKDSDNLYYYVYDLNDFQLDVFNDFGGPSGGWGDVTISALVTGLVNNDFQINTVGMNASVVPEPGTLLCLGAGLAGLAVVRRRSR